MIRYLSLLVAVLVVICAQQAFSQEGMEKITPEAYETLTRPPALFDHDLHEEKADCADCHHGGEDGKLDPDMSSEGIPCADCHAVDAPKGTDLTRAYHKQCITCHEQTRKGPLSCGECHKK
jgi:hypothetical protein